MTQVAVYGGGKNTEWAVRMVDWFMQKISVYVFQEHRVPKGKRLPGYDRVWRIWEYNSKHYHGRYHGLKISYSLETCEKLLFLHLIVDWDGVLTFLRGIREDVSTLEERSEAWENTGGEIDQCGFKSTMHCAL